MTEKDKKKYIGYDLDGYDTITAALRELLNSYPGLSEGEEITFSTLDEDGGISMYPIGSAVIESEKKYITGEREQICFYPFSIVHRGMFRTENNKANVKEWLDNIGRWLERQEVTVKDEKIRLERYPPLSGEMQFLTIQRATSGHLDVIEENGAEDWVISITARYSKKIR